jgi:hypothetical protein
MDPLEPLPRVVLICHEQDSLDHEGLAAWLACTMRLSGIVAIRGDGRRRWRAARREMRRTGFAGLADIAALRLYARVGLARADRAWVRRRLDQLRRDYPADLGPVARLGVSDPNSEAARTFLALLRPDLIVARCKFILKPEIFELARAGAFALHPGICPEYRNAHGCFWALVNRDLDRVGMTLLRIDRGVDTGPIYLHAAAAIDERRETHIVIQHRVVFDNLDAIGRVLLALARGQDLTPVSTAGRRSAAWGQPGLSHYLRWKWAARNQRRKAPEHPST